MATTLNIAEQRVVLRNVSWETYLRLLSEHENSSAPRFTYDCGDLEIMSPYAEHERFNLMIAGLIDAIADEMNLRWEALGANTFQREDLKRGFEADSCFYVQNVERVLNKARIDLKTDPPPDLVIEIEITSSAINKLPLLASFGVPEVWVYDGSRLKMFRLTGGRYEAAEESVIFPGVSAAATAQMLEQGKALDRTGWLRKCRAWAHQRFGDGNG